MSDPLITVGLNSQPIVAVFGQILRRMGGGTRPLMREVAGIMFAEVEENFAAQGRPRWLDLKSVNLARAGYKRTKAGRWSLPRNRKVGYQILQASGRLASSITQAYSSGSASVGTNVVYAAIHQFGGKTKPHKITAKNGKALALPGVGFRKSVQHPGSVIPARPFLTISPGGEAKIARAGEAFLRDVIGG